MKAAYARLGLAVILFVGWLGYLGYLVAERPIGTTAVLSRPQFLVSDLDIVASVKQGSNTVKVSAVLFPATAEARALLGKEIKVANLGDCRPPTDRQKLQPDLSGDGDYLLALQEPGPGEEEYRVCATPPSPGFEHGTPRIYPYTKNVAAQYAQIPKN